MQDKRISWMPSCFTKTEIYEVQGKGKEAVGCRVLYVPGINTGEAEAREGAEALSGHCNGVKVSSICNPSRGTSTDAFLFPFVKLGVVTPAIRALAISIERAYISAELESDNPRIYIHAHSRGALETKMALELISECMRSAIHVRTYGGAGIIGTNEGFGSVVNFMNRGDPNLTLNLNTYLLTDYITMTDQPASLNPLVNHSIMGEGYQNAMNQIAKEDILTWKLK